MMSKDDFIIADEDIDALMDELKHFSPSGAEPFFSEAGRASSRSGQTGKQDAARTATAGAASRTAGRATSSPARVSASSGSSSVQSGRPESSGVPSYTAQASAPPRKTEKKKHGFIWVLIVLAIIIFAYPRIKVNKKEPEPLQPEVTQPVIEQDCLIVTVLGEKIVCFLPQPLLRGRIRQFPVRLRHEPLFCITEQFFERTYRIVSVLLMIWSRLISSTSIFLFTFSENFIQRLLSAFLAGYIPGKTRTIKSFSFSFPAAALLISRRYGETRSRAMRIYGSPGYE